MLHAPVNPQQWNRCAWQLRKVGSYNYSAFIVADFTWIDANVLSFIWHHRKETDIQCIDDIMFVYENNRNWGWLFFFHQEVIWFSMFQYSCETCADVLILTDRFLFMCSIFFRNGSFSCFVDPLVALQCVLNIHCAHMNRWYKGNLCQI